jgi:hydrogenase maturation factor
MTAETLKPGDRVVVTGSPARGGADGLYVRQLDRAADGFR